MNQEISSDKYSHAFFIDRRELYQLDGTELFFVGNKNSVEELINIDVKSWKPYTIAHNKDDDDWFITNDQKETLYSVYLGVKNK
jgi:hypothetical protein